MSSSEAQIPTYFAGHAFAHYRNIASGVTYDLDQLQAISDLSGKSFGPDRQLPIELDAVAFLYRFARPGFGQPKLDGPFHKAGPNAPYIPASELQLPPSASPATVTKGDMLRDHSGIMQLQVENPSDPLAVAFAKTLVYPPAEDAKLKASGFAWLNQVADALSPKRSEANRQQFLETVAGRYAGAILLKGRSGSSAVEQRGR